MEQNNVEKKILDPQPMTGEELAALLEKANKAQKVTAMVFLHGYQAGKAAAAKEQTGA